LEIGKPRSLLPRFLSPETTAELSSCNRDCRPAKLKYLLSSSVKKKLANHTLGAQIRERLLEVLVSSKCSPYLPAFKSSDSKDIQSLANVIVVQTGGYERKRRWGFHEKTSTSERHRGS
jgi:hypothetical protein